LKSTRKKSSKVAEGKSDLSHKNLWEKIAFFFALDGF
jgi:hypothetical protein